MIIVLCVSVAANVALFLMFRNRDKRYGIMKDWAKEKRLAGEELDRQLGALNIDFAQLQDDLALTNTALLAAEEKIAGYEEKIKTLEAKEVNAYPVSGQRHVPWAIRRKELEAQHRTKRKAIEEFREG